MNELVATSIKSMQEQGLRLLLPDDLADLIELNTLADAVTADIFTPEYEAALRPELHLGGIVLRRPSIGALEDIEERVSTWFADDARLFIIGLAYCMAHGNAPCKLWQYDDAEDFARMLRTWSRDIGVTFDDLQNGIKRFQSLEEKAAEVAKHWKPNKSDRGWLIELLMSEYGGTVDQWVWQTPLNEIQLLLKRRSERKRAEAQAQGGKTPADPDSPYIRALYNFRLKESQIIAVLTARKKKASP
jgi:hypothetical protein